LGLFAPLLFITDTYFRWIFITVDSEGIPDTMIYLLLNLNTCYDRWLFRDRIVNSQALSFESFLPFLNIPLAHIVIAIQKSSL